MKPEGLDNLCNEDLAVLVAAGNRSAEEILVRKNQGFLRDRAYKFARGRQSMTVDDLTNEGAMGLLHCAREKYDPERETKFLTYAGWWVQAYMMRAIREQDQLIRMSSQAFDLSNRWRKMSSNNLSDDEIEMQLREQKHRRDRDHDVLLGASRGRFRPISLNVALFDSENEEGTATRLDLLRCDPDQENRLGDLQERVALHRKLLVLRKQLEPRMLALFDERIMVDEEPATLTDLGARFNLTRERMRQLELLLLQQIRRTLLGDSDLEIRRPANFAACSECGGTAIVAHPPRCKKHAPWRKAIGSRR